MKHTEATVILRAAATDQSFIDSVADELMRRTRCWADDHGYDLVEDSATVECDFDTGFFDKTLVRVTVECRPRWHGLWGHLRACLDEDGLLPAADRPEAPAALGSWPVGTVTAFAHRHDDGMLETVLKEWTGTAWVPLPGARVVAIDPADPPPPPTDPPVPPF